MLGRLFCGKKQAVVEQEVATLRQRITQLEKELTANGCKIPNEVGSRKFERRTSIEKLQSLQTKEDDETQLYIRSQFLASGCKPHRCQYNLFLSPPYTKKETRNVM